MNSTSTIRLGEPLIITEECGFTKPTKALDLLKWLTGILESQPMVERDRIILSTERYGSDPQLLLLKKLTKEEQDAATIRNSLSYLQSLGITADEIRQQLESPDQTEP